MNKSKFRTPSFDNLPNAVEEALERLEALEKDISLIKEHFNITENSKAKTEKDDIELLSIIEAAAYLKITRETLHRWIRENRITYSKIGSKKYFKKYDLENMNKIVLKIPKGLR